jgi:hypothetical protein
VRTAGPPAQQAKRELRRRGRHSSRWPQPLLCLALRSPCRQRLDQTLAATRTPSRFQVPDASYDYVARNQGLIRSLPLWGGALGFAGLLANRFISGVRWGPWRKGPEEDRLPPRA